MACLLKDFPKIKNDLLIFFFNDNRNQVRECVHISGMTLLCSEDDKICSIMS